MKNEMIIEELRKEANQNPVFNAVCHVLSLRQRARFSLTMAGLTQRMKKEGFHYSRKEYEEILKFLAKLELGKLKLNHNTKIVGLVGLAYRLDSIGTTALDKASKPLEVAKFRNHFKSFVVNKADTALRKDVGENLKIMWKDTPIAIVIPQEASENDILQILKMLRHE